MREDDDGPRGPERIDDPDFADRFTAAGIDLKGPVTPEPPDHVGGPHELHVWDRDNLPADVEVGDATNPDDVSGDVTPQDEGP